jgi:hypothetical protein
MTIQYKMSSLEALAERLIARHLRVSVPDSTTRHDLQLERETEPLLEQDMRCIAIVGAGASAPVLRRGEELAAKLEKGESDKPGFEAELFRLERVYGLDRRDFETRLAALSRTPQAAQSVRERIAQDYAFRHPTILGYELIAHLLKHRFLDAVISFNFDELLDQSLDDELGTNGYRKLISNRDCVNVDHDPDSSEYLPLYIKLHGTAAEPESLRMTRDAYYELPQKLIGEVHGLLRCERAVIVNVGSAMTGFDLHRVLRIPERLEIYDLSPRSLEQTVRDDIDGERLEPRPDSLYKHEERKEAEYSLLSDEARRVTKCDRWLQRLVAEMESRTGDRADPNTVASLVRFRSTDRHEAVASVLGANEILSRWTDDFDEHRTEYVRYLRQRTVLELALSGAKARGLAQLSWLALDRSGSYYELYRQAVRPGKPETWSSLRAAAGMDENKALPDVVESQPGLCAAAAGPTLRKDGSWALREFTPSKLAHHVTARIGRNGKDGQRLSRALKNLQAGSEVEIQATDDQVCAKAFDSPLTLPTITALNVFTISLFKDIAPEDEVYISCETGEWLLSEQMRELLSRQEKVVVVTAFDFKFEKLEKLYGTRLTLRAVNPWRHNRHMTIVCDGSTASRAVYFARRLRAPKITPVYLSGHDDAKRVKHAFDLMLQE